MCTRILRSTLVHDLLAVKILILFLKLMSMASKLWTRPKCGILVSLPVTSPGGGGNLTCPWYGVVPFLRVPFS